MSMGLDLGGPEPVKGVITAAAPVEVEVEPAAVEQVALAAATVVEDPAFTQEDDLEDSSLEPSLNRNERFSLSTNLV